MKHYFVNYYQSVKPPIENFLATVMAGVTFFGTGSGVKRATPITSETNISSSDINRDEKP